MSAALIGAAASLGGSLMNYHSQDRMNAEQRAYNLQMYTQQREDNKEAWRSQNAYNHPLAQMQRLRDAGLNPHLVYGKGADATAGPIQGASPQSWNPSAPQLDVAGPINTYFDASQKEAQTDNLKVMNTLYATDALIKAEELKSKTRDNKFGEEMYTTQAQILQEQQRKLMVDNNYTAEKNDREQEMHVMNLQNAVEQQLNSKAGRQYTEQQIENLKGQLQETRVQTLLREAELKLRRQGFNPNGPLYERIIGNIIDEATKGKSIYSLLKEWLF